MFDFWENSRKIFSAEKKTKNIFGPEKNSFFLNLTKKVGILFRCRKLIAFDWRGFQSDSGTLPRVRCKYVSPKLQKSSHFRSLPANRPLANLVSRPPLPTLKPNKNKLAIVTVLRFYISLTMILSCKKNIVVTSEPDPHLLDPYNLLDPGFLDYLFLTL